MAAVGSYGTLPALNNRKERQSLKTEQRRTVYAGTAAVLLVAACCVCVYVVSNSRAAVDPTALTGIFGNEAGPSSRSEGSNGLIYGGGNRQMRDEVNFMVGSPGWEPGPDYYSTENWNNADLNPSSLRSSFDPYVGVSACPNCHKEIGQTFEMSVVPRCDYSPQAIHIRNILKLDMWWQSPAFSSALYKENHWIGAQIGHFITSGSLPVVLVPPCFLPRLSKKELHVLNAALYQMGMSLLIVGGMQGANFISQNLAGLDGFGYVDSGGVDAFTDNYDIDTVFSDGPFYMQNAAVTTELFYGPRMLEGLRTTVGIPARKLPPNTVSLSTCRDNSDCCFLERNLVVCVLVFRVEVEHGLQACTQTHSHIHTLSTPVILDRTTLAH
jgi:hypothetical protein